MTENVHPPGGERAGRAADPAAREHPSPAAPAVLFATAQQAQSAVASGSALGMAVTLVTAAGACARLGPGYLLEAVHRAGRPPALLDCGSDPGWAMLALRLGWRDLHLAGPSQAGERIAAMAAACGARFHPALPDAFDLEADPAGLDAWLARFSTQAGDCRRRPPPASIVA